MVILRITIADGLRASKDVDSVIASCSQSMYALRVLKAHGQPAAALHTVTWSTGRCTPYSHQGHHYRPTAICIPFVVGPCHRKRPSPCEQTLHVYEDQTHGLPS